MLKLSLVFLFFLQPYFCSQVDDLASIAAHRLITRLLSHQSLQNEKITKINRISVLLVSIQLSDAKDMLPVYL